MIRKLLDRVDAATALTTGSAYLNARSLDEFMATFSPGASARDHQQVSTIVARWLGDYGLIQLPTPSETASRDLGSRLLAWRDSIFVFGSNLAGRHGAGAALHARREHGAVYGVGVGRTGRAYAIPTKCGQLLPLPLSDISAHVLTFLDYARTHHTLTFLVTKVGCGLAGYSESDIAPMFSGASDNCILPDGWRNA